MEEIERNFELVAPRNITRFNYPPKSNQIKAVESFSMVYSSIDCFTNHYNSEGRKVLLVSDGFVTIPYKKDEKTDVDRDCIFSGLEGGTLQNIIGYCVGQMNKNVQLKTVTVFQLAFFLSKF